jgi:hypothetical protein
MSEAGEQSANNIQQVEEDLVAAVHAARWQLAIADERSREQATAELSGALARLVEVLFRQEPH